MDRADELAAWTWDQLSPLDLPEHPLPEAPRRVVLGFDGSPQSLEAASWAAALASQVDVVTALDVSAAVFLPTDEAPLTRQWVKVLKQRAEDGTPELEDALKGCKVHTHMLESGPSRALMGTAREVGADLIVIGHAGKGVLDRLVLGSVAEALVHHAEVPVLVARGPMGAGPIVAGIGGDDGSEHAAAWATALAARFERDLVLAHASRELEEVTVLAEGEPGARMLGLPWPPKKGVAALAELGAGLLVVGHRPGRRWLGSTAISLIRNAPCSVLVARPTPSQEEGG